MANFDSEFLGLVFPGYQATQKIHAQNSRPELSAFLSNFTFSNPKFIHGDFLLTGETKQLLPAVLLLLRIYFPKITVTATVLTFRWIKLITITVTVLASAVTPSFPLVPNYHLESHLNKFPPNYRYRYRLEMLLN